MLFRHKFGPPCFFNINPLISATALMMIFSGYVATIVKNGLITSAQVFGVEEGYLKSTLVLIACDWEVL